MGVGRHALRATWAADLSFALGFRVGQADGLRHASEFPEQVLHEPLLRGSRAEPPPQCILFRAMDQSTASQTRSKRSRASCRVRTWVDGCAETVRSVARPGFGVPGIMLPASCSGRLPRRNGPPASWNRPRGSCRAPEPRSGGFPNRSRNPRRAAEPRRLPEGPSAGLTLACAVSLLSRLPWPHR